jgi:threonine/homoserine/homoserine lactone efflux protein
MLKHYLEGIVLGLPLMFLTGPVLLTLLQASIRSGQRSGLAVAIGIIVSDILCVILSYFGVSQILTTGQSKQWVFVGGGVIVLVFGLVSLFKTPKIPELPPPVTSKALASFFAQGFLVNGVNPFVLLFWAGAMSGAISRQGTSAQPIGWYIAGTLTVIFASDIIKALAAHRLKGYLTVRALTWINRIAGIGLVGFGVYLIGQVFFTPT